MSREAATARLAHHAESSATVDAPVNSVFAHVDDHRRLSSHMSESSWMMGGGRMEIEVDAANFQRVGSHLRLAGRVFGIYLWVEEAVTERTAPHHKVWETTLPPKLLVIGPYRMGFDITAEGRGARLRVFIDYERPSGFSRWLSYLFGPLYARWCTQQMVRDATRQFASG